MSDNQELKRKASKMIEQYTKEGDVININADFDIRYQIGYWAIRKAQKSLFGEDSSYEDTHTMMKFNNSSIKKYIFDNGKVKEILGKNNNPLKKVFSVEPPRTTFIPTEDFCLDHITVYRYTKKKLTKQDIKIMLHCCTPILLTRYDFGQLVNIAVNQILGYPFEEKTTLFDFGSKNKVCSVGVGYIFQKWRKTLESQGLQKPDRLFSKPNPNKWDKDFLKKYKENGNRWNIENYYPALFANSHMFDNEFEKVLEMKDGILIYKE